MDIWVILVPYDSLKNMMPTPLSQNPRHGIKSSKWATHRPWPARFIHAMSANARRHQPRPACIGRAMCPSGKRRRPTRDDIGRGLPASVVACAHRLTDVGRSLRTLLSPSRAWPARITPCLHTTVSQRQTWPAHIVRGLHLLDDQRCTWQHLSSLDDNMWMSMPNKNQKSVKHPSCITTYSSIFYYLFSTFPPHVVHSY